MVDTDGYILALNEGMHGLLQTERQYNKKALAIVQKLFL